MQDKTSMWSRCYWSRLRLLRGGGKKDQSLHMPHWLILCFSPAFSFPPQKHCGLEATSTRLVEGRSQAMSGFGFYWRPGKGEGGGGNHCRRCLGVSTKMLVGILSDHANLVLAAQFPALWMCAVLFVAALALRKQNCWSLFNCLSWTE